MTTAPNSSAPQRPPFSPAQLVQAEYIGRVTEAHRSQRPTVATHAIDNVTPDIIADRDDGIFVQVEPTAGKGYLVHITVADVAAHVRYGSPLSEAAWQRAFTVYKPGSTDSMFPKILEENLSLEHGKERLGLTVNIRLDEHFKPIHTSFTPVITSPDNASYEQARQRMKSDPQFSLMARIADNIRRSNSGTNGAAWDELVEDRLMRRGSSDTDMEAMQMVATYMLLANHCVAEFFSETQLPFLYRNFDSSLNDAHARYSTEPLRHTALESMGMAGAYCHFTSPIRRAPDYFNGVMVHYVVNVMAELEQYISQACPVIQDQKLNAQFRQKLNEGLWQNAPEIIRLASNTTARARSRADLRALLHGIANEASPGHDVPEQALAVVINRFDLPPLPLAKAQLDTYADHMNALAHSPQMVQISRLNEKKVKSEELMAGISGMSAEGLAAIEAGRFSSILQAAAITGEMPQNLFDETLTRLRTRKPRLANDMPRPANDRPRIADCMLDRMGDIFAIFLQAQYPSSERWRSLKREVARMIKDDPGTVNVLLYWLDRTAPDSITEKYSVSSRESEGDRPLKIHKAQLRMKRDDGSVVATPMGSIGHDRRAVISHARFSFLEHYAFSQLQQVDPQLLAREEKEEKEKNSEDREDTIPTPNKLYADLDLPGAKKRELFERMVRESDAELKIRTQKTPAGCHTVIQVDGPDITVPIITEAEEATEEESVRTAIRRMLRNEVFKLAMSRHEQGTQYLLNPQTVLEAELSKRGGRVQFTIVPVSSKSSDGYRATATVYLSGEEAGIPYDATASNKPRALRKAAARALEALGTITLVLPHRVASWALQTDRLSADGGLSPG